MFTWLLDLLKMPETKTQYRVNTGDIDEEESTLFHKKIIKNKPFLYKLYLEFYDTFKENSKDIPDGLKVELGSGGGFLKEIVSDVITSDVIALSGVDKVFFAEKMPFPDNSVSVFFLLSTLHHIKQPDGFFSEVKRCLKKEGKVIMIEPTNSAFSRFFL